MMDDATTVFLEARGLDAELAVKMGWDTETRDGEAWLAIPYVREGQLLYRQLRRVAAKDFRNDAGSEAELWNIDALYDESLASAPLVIAEGACDGLALVQSGYIRTVAVPGWSEKNVTADKYEPFRRHEAALQKVGRVIVAQHADNTGAALLKAISNLLPEADVHYVVWPDGCKDANDALLLTGPEGVVGALNRSKAVDPPGGMITGFSDLPPVPTRAVWKLGLDFMDKVMAFRSREFSVLTGTPGAGKTTFATWCAYHLARQNGIRVGLALLESDAEEVRHHLRRLGGEGFDLDQHFRVLHRIEDPTLEIPHGMAWLMSMISKAATTHGCNVIFVDPWNELEHTPERGENMTQYINFALMRIRQWADKFDIHICIVAHPKKMEAGVKPVGYHVADSAAFFNKPGMGWTIHAEDESERFYEHISLTTWKVRSRESTGCMPGVRRIFYDEHGMVYRTKDFRKPAKEKTK